LGNIIANVPVRSDNYADEGDAAYNYSSFRVLKVAGTAVSNQEKYTFLKPVWPDIDFSVAKWINVTLELHPYVWSAGTYIFNIQAIGENSPNTGINDITWNNKPTTMLTAAGTVLGTIIADGSTRPITTFDLTSIWNYIEANGNTYRGLRIMLDSTSPAQGTATFFSLNQITRMSLITSSGSVPNASYEYEPLILKPRNLKPDGGKYRADTTPLLTADFINSSQLDADTGNDQTLQASNYQIQLSTAANFSTTEWDKTVNSTATTMQFNPDAHGMSTLSVGTLYYWRVRWTSEGGQTSAWSNTATFTIQGKPGVTLDSPSTSSITDMSPNVQWTYTADGITASPQNYYRVIVRRFQNDKLLWPQQTYDRDSQKWRWHDGFSTGWKAGAVDSFQIAPDILEPGQKYRFTIQVRDEFDRDNDYTDTSYAEDSQDTVIDPTNGVAVVSNLSANQWTSPYDSGHPPIVTLTWNGSNDRYLVQRRRSTRAQWVNLEEGAAATFDNDAASGYVYQDQGVAIGQGFYYRVLPKDGTGGTVGRSSNLNYDFANGTAHYDMYTSGSGAADPISGPINDEALRNGVYLRTNITNGGAGATEVRFRHPTAGAGTVTAGATIYYDVMVRAREANRGGTFAIVHEGGSVIGTKAMELTPYKWTTSRGSMVAGTTTSQPIRAEIYLGNEGEINVDVAHFLIDYNPLASVSVASRGSWLIPTDKWSLRVPFTYDMSEPDIAWEENITTHHPIGGNFVVVRAGDVARKININCRLNQYEEDYLDRLQQIMEGAYPCRLLLNSNQVYYVEVVRVTDKPHRDAQGGAGKWHSVSVEMVEIDKPNNV
jgi:hypothetical protein